MLGDSNWQVRPQTELQSTSGPRRLHVLRMRPRAPRTDSSVHIVRLRRPELEVSGSTTCTTKPRGKL